MLCTGAPGILESVDDPRSIVSYTDLAGLARLKAQGSLKDGMLPKAKAIEDAIRGGVRRARHIVQIAGQHPRGSIHERRHGHADHREHQRSVAGGAAQLMSRLWDKGSKLDERVLQYTAGDDHALDNRLVAHDVRASIAHAEMLHAQGLLTAADLAAILAV